MGSTTRVLTTAEISEGEMKKVLVQGKPIAILQIGNEYFAVDDTCSHAECSFADAGFLEGDTIICGCHGAQFDATTGKVLSLPATRDVDSYKVTVDGDDIHIHINQ